MNLQLILGVSMVFGLLCNGLIGKWYVMPALTRQPITAALSPLLLFHSFRFLGLAFLIVGVTSTSLDPRFANPAAYGDLLAALLALLALTALRRSWPFALPLVWIFNIVGALDLLNALFQGLRYVPLGDFGATYFIPVIIVPALLVSHLMIFQLLIRQAAREDPT